MTKEKYDLVVLGGGIAGYSAAENAQHALNGIIPINRYS